MSKRPIRICASSRTSAPGESLVGGAVCAKLIAQGLLTYLGAKAGSIRRHPPSARSTASTRAICTNFGTDQITNSLRVNKQKELDRGVEMARLLQTELGQRLKQEFPGFRVITDPAYISIRGENGESGFEVVIRENPFMKTTVRHV
ncbi:IucA/IucC family protein [Bacillus licheniformis]|nr:IucA/IucC family protein [Bacillus licheniformis]